MKATHSQFSKKPAFLIAGVLALGVFYQNCESSGFKIASPTASATAQSGAGGAVLGSPASSSSGTASTGSPSGGSPTSGTTPVALTTPNSLPVPVVATVAPVFNVAQTAATGGSMTGDPIPAGLTYTDDFHEATPFTTLAFHDEFNAGGLNTKIWTSVYTNKNTRAGVGGDQSCYSDSNVSLGNGYLLLTAMKQSLSNCGGAAGTFSYTSGMATTQNSFSHQYGYFAVRAIMPPGVGLWPAFWLMPDTDQWTSEVDIYENFMVNPTIVTQTYHWGNGANSTDQGAYAGTVNPVSNVSDTSKNFHVYAVSWQPGSMNWMIDGKVTNTFTQSLPTTAMYILLNLGVTKVMNPQWTPTPDASTPFPATMAVDWVRVYVN